MIDDQKPFAWPDRFDQRFHIFALGEAFDVDAYTGKSSLRPDFVWRQKGNGPTSGVEFLLGDARSLSLHDQERVAVEYLAEHRDDLRDLAQFPGVETLNLCVVYFVPLHAAGFCVGPSRKLMFHALDSGVSLRYYGTLMSRDRDSISYHHTVPPPDVLAWLLDSDPAIRWQAMRDLTDASPASIAAERARVSREGLGAAILAAQQPDGSWRRPDKPLWLSTLFTFLLLRATGIDPAEPSVQSAVTRLEAGLRWNDLGGRWELRAPHTGGNTFFEGEVEPCINGGALAVGSYFGRSNESLARRLLAEQLDDGGWNCEAPKSSCSSFHTTICVLEGLLEFESAIGSAPGIAAARKRGEEYLLERSLFRRKSTGEVANPGFLELAFPPRYRYDILRALDYFRAAGALPDERMAEAAAVIDSKRRPDGRWLLDRCYDETLDLSLGEVPGEPSRWNTLRALRVLRWFGKPDES